VQKGPSKESLQGQEGPDALLQEAIKMAPRRRRPTRAASRKGGKIAGRASRACRGKKGRAFQACRRAYFRKRR